eukprot:scpid36432/ scgid35632/ 
MAATAWVVYFAGKLLVTFLCGCTHAVDPMTHTHHVDQIFHRIIFIKFCDLCPVGVCWLPPSPHHITVILVRVCMLLCVLDVVSSGYMRTPRHALYVQCVC